MHGLWSIALQYTIEYTLCEPSIVIKKGIFRLCSLETKNSAVPLCFRIPNPALRRVTCAIRTLLMPSASQNLLPDALWTTSSRKCFQPVTLPLCCQKMIYSFRSTHLSILKNMQIRRFCQYFYTISCINAPFTKACCGNRLAPVKPIRS